MLISELGEFDKSLELLTFKDDLKLEGISPADYPTDNTIVFVKNKRFAEKLKLSLEKERKEICLILNKSITDIDWFKENLKNIGLVDSVDLAMCEYSKEFHRRRYSHLNVQVDGRQMGTCEIDPSAEISQNVFIGENVSIGKNCKVYPGTVILPHCKIGDETVLYPNVSVYPYTEIGNNCSVNSGTIIGADGFGYNFVNGEHRKIYHFMGVKIGNNVEIGAGTMIDSGAFTPTEIGDGTKIDNDCQIAHNAKIGKHCILCGKAGVAGSVVVEDYCVFGAGAGAAPGAYLESGCQLGSYAIVSENIRWPAGTKLAGQPARPLKEWLRGLAKVREL